MNNLLNLSNVLTENALSSKLLAKTSKPESALSKAVGILSEMNTFENNMNQSGVIENAGTIRNEALPVKTGFWQKFKAFWLQDIDWNQEIRVELTPAQLKVEDEINEFLHQEITWEKVHDFLFQEVSFGKKKNNK